MSFSKVPPHGNGAAAREGGIREAPRPAGKTSVENSSDTLINILLLGETGVGKSTFINSFANYAQHSTLEEAANSELSCLIPTKFTHTDEDFIEREVKYGYDKNEDHGTGQSGTQSVRNYVFETEDNRKIQLIDTPGSGDVRGREQDDRNFENILDFLGVYEYLHAICILLRPNENRLSEYFEYCFNYLLSRLDKSAAQNIIFVFTNTSGTFYKPKNTMPLLRELLGKIERNPPNVKIPCNKNNIFCMDNEAFQYLVGLKHDCSYTAEEGARFTSSWKISREACYKILDYVTGEDEKSVKPHLIRNTLSVNHVRRVINGMSKILNDIFDVIQENLDSLNQREKEVAVVGQSIEEFKKKLKVPSVILHHNELESPRTVCTSAKCIERIVHNDKVHIRYKQICCSNCSAPFISAEYPGSYMLYFFCNSFRWDGTCKHCECNSGKHMHIYYDLQIEEVEVDDESMVQKINSTEDQIRVQEEFIAKLQIIKSEYEAERETIVKCLAKLAYFLKDHAIAAFNDEFEKHLDDIIKREEGFGAKANENFLDNHVALKRQYQEEKRILESILKNPNKEQPQGVTVNEVNDLISKLYGLKLMGKYIEELNSIQERVMLKTTKANTESLSIKAIRIKTSIKNMVQTAVSSARNMAATFMGNASGINPMTSVQDGTVVSSETRWVIVDKAEEMHK